MRPLMAMAFCRFSSFWLFPPPTSPIFALYCAVRSLSVPCSTQHHSGLFVSVESSAKYLEGSIFLSLWNSPGFHWSDAEPFHTCT